MQEGKGSQRGCLVQLMPALCEQQNPEAQATWLQAPVGLEEGTQNVVMEMAVSWQLAGQGPWGDISSLNGV